MSSKPIPTSSQIGRNLIIAFVILFNGIPALSQELKTNPATDLEVFTYVQYAAVNICDLIANKVPFSTAFPSGIRAFGWIMDKRHGNAVANFESGKSMSNTQVINGGIAQIAVSISEGCGDKLKGNDKKELDDIVSNVKSAAAAQAPAATPKPPK